MNIPEHISLKTFLMANSGGFSAKRLAGLSGYVICLLLLIYATVVGAAIPSFSNMVLIASTSLLGVDAFKGIFTRSE